ncbi:hypothetical protein CDD83_5073 [Cordyceps sp. RAO-2017]|nr:hypothetical protein CDD83_5073 [Cordyceps sp. RAO-2017]
MMINDLGQDPQPALDYRSRTGQDISTLNHDIILLKAAEVSLVPCIDQLPPALREDLMRGIPFGAECNFGQLAQAENALACLSGLRDMREQERAFNLHFMEQMIDNAGTAGYKDWTCAWKLIQLIFEAYRNVREVALGILSGGKDQRQGYDVILTGAVKF